MIFVWFNVPIANNYFQSCVIRYSHYLLKYFSESFSSKATNKKMISVSISPYRTTYICLCKNHLFIVDLSTESIGRKKCNIDTTIILLLSKDEKYTQRSSVLSIKIMAYKTGCIVLVVIENDNMISFHVYIIKRHEEISL